MSDKTGQGVRNSAQRVCFLILDLGLVLPMRLNRRAGEH
jgi:hypothetical protein